MTNLDAFNAFASIIERNPRYIELVEKQEDHTITAEELEELNQIVDFTFFNPFVFKTFTEIDEYENPEEKIQHKAIVQDMISRGVIG